MLSAGRVGVVLGMRAVADHEELDVVEQTRTCPERVAEVAVDLVERLTNRDATALQLDVNHRQAVHQYGHVVAVAAASNALPVTDLVLVDDLEAVVVDVLLVDKRDVPRDAVVAFQRKLVVLLQSEGLFCDAVAGL